MEAILPLEVVEALPHLGLTPLTQLPTDLGGDKRPDTIYIHLAMSLRLFPDPTGERIGRLIAQSTLAYSLALGRTINLGLRLVSGLAGLEPAQAAESLRESLGQALGSLAKGEFEVTPGPGVLSVRLKPELKIHGKEFEIAADIPFAD